MREKKRKKDKTENQIKKGMRKTRKLATHKSHGRGAAARHEGALRPGLLGVGRPNTHRNGRADGRIPWPWQRSRRRVRARRLDG